MELLAQLLLPLFNIIQTWVTDGAVITVDLLQLRVDNT